jgi:hypothetical protein
MKKRVEEVAKKSVEEKLKRKIISFSNGYALCDDGSLWLLGGIVDNWQRIQDIPQD